VGQRVQGAARPLVEEGRELPGGAAHRVRSHRLSAIGSIGIGSYYVGNCDIIIDNDEFKKIADCFVAHSVKTNPVLKGKHKVTEIPDAKPRIDNYFKELLADKLNITYAKNFN
jgi:hypothetical protein